MGIDCKNLQKKLGDKTRRLFKAKKGGESWIGSRAQARSSGLRACRV